ncbi:MAG TPA: class II aldolase/adducin family protein [Xanthobacteraceae bacterium]|nr:class II aldolase/adducin family protein [Xanthobacteraceae bacterium]
MPKLDVIIEELVTANRILAHEDIVDSFGHVSARHPERKDRFLLSRARAPERIEAADIMEFTLEGDAVDARGRKPYLERFIHGALFEARPEINCVVHNHSPSTIPFGVTGKKMRPLLHMCASIGHNVPLWDSQKKFGDTDLLVSNMAMGRDLAKAVGKGRSALMRGHGAVVVGTSIRQAIWIAIYLELNAKLQMQAMSMGAIKYLTNGEVDAIIGRQKAFSYNRAWENWCIRAGRKMQELEGE